MLEQALEQWHDWGFDHPPTLIKKFTAGKSHHTGLITDGRQRFVIKVFNHSAEQAVSAQRWAAELDLAPRVFFYKKNLALMEFIETSTSRDLPLNSLAKALARLHSQVIEESEPNDLVTVLETYVGRLSKDIMQEHQTHMPAVHEFIQDSTPHCFSHNDLVNENCLYDNQRVVLLDWEYAGQQNPWFDLGSIFLYRGLTQTRIWDFLNVYQAHRSEPLRELSERMIVVAQITVLWTDLLWHLVELGSNYRRTHAHRFEQLNKLEEHLGRYG